MGCMDYCSAGTRLSEVWIWRLRICLAVFCFGCFPFFFRFHVSLDSLAHNCHDRKRCALLCDFLPLHPRQPRSNKLIFKSNQAANIRVILPQALEACRARRSASQLESEGTTTPGGDTQAEHAAKRVRFSTASGDDSHSVAAPTPTITSSTDNRQSVVTHDSRNENDNSVWLIQCIGCMNIVGEYYQDESLYVWKDVLPSYWKKKFFCLALLLFMFWHENGFFPKFCQPLMPDIAYVL